MRSAISAYDLIEHEQGVALYEVTESRATRYAVVCGSETRVMSLRYQAEAYYGRLVRRRKREKTRQVSTAGVSENPVLNQSEKPNSENGARR